MIKTKLSYYKVGATVGGASHFVVLAEMYILRTYILITLIISYLFDHGTWGVCVTRDMCHVTPPTLL